MEDEYYLAAVDDGNALTEIIDKLAMDDIEAMAESRIYGRGLDYYKDNYVEIVEHTDDKIVAKVEGSYQSSYRVQIVIDEKDLLGSCTCPYDDVCKHIIATVIQAKMNPDISDEKTNHDQEVFIDHLNTLSKEDLVALVDKFAPRTYRIEVAMKGASNNEINVSLQGIERAIDFSLNDDKLLYDPSAFLDVGVGHLECLEAHVNCATEQVFEIVFKFVEDIEEKNDDGYLYSDGYYYDVDDYFDFEYFSEKIVGMIDRIDNPKMQAETFLDFALLCEDSDYMHINYDSVKIKQKSLLIESLDDISNLSFYGYIEELLTFDQKIAYLYQFPAKTVAGKIVSLYKINGQEEKAIVYVEELLVGEFKIAYAELLLTLMEISKERLQLFVKHAIDDNDYTAYDFIVKHIKRCDNMADVESYFEKKKPHWYYDYLEADKRVEEMHDMLKILESNKLSFFTKYKHQYKDEAIDFFKAEINNELEFTGNSYYETIASHLKELQTLIEKEPFDAMVHRLKVEYKRRRNFVKILSTKFGSG